MHLYKPVGRLCDVSMHLRIAAYNCNGEYIYVCVEEDLRIWKRNSLVVRQYHSDDTLLIFLFSPLVPPLLLEKKITMAGWRRKEEGEDSEEKKKKGELRDFLFILDAIGVPVRNAIIPLYPVESDAFPSRFTTSYLGPNGSQNDKVRKRWGLKSEFWFKNIKMT